mgnify:CR=1 FL=1|tara:strand:- start:143 stop:1063 length:921 start_codon:yes stop_codon:yes gene_type:complete
MAPKKATLFFNPTSGYGRKKNIFQKHPPHKQYYESLLKTIKETFESQHIKLTTITIDKTINTTDIAAKLSPDETDVVIAAGGDGTINKIINGLMISKIPLGIIPIGSVNILALDLGISNDVKQACNQIINGSLKKIDIGKVNKHYFSAMAGIGFDAKVIKHTPIQFKKKHGLLSFFYIAFKLLPTYKFRPIHVSIDTNTPVQTAYFIIINNSKYYGGKFIVSPQSSLTDGKLDISLLKKGNFISLLRFFKHLIHGTLHHCKDVQLIQASTLTVQENEKHHTHIDAEYIGKHPITVHSIPLGLSIIY